MPTIETIYTEHDLSLLKFTLRKSTTITKYVTNEPAHYHHVVAYATDRSTGTLGNIFLSPSLAIAYTHCVQHDSNTADQ